MSETQFEAVCEFRRRLQCLRCVEVECEMSATNSTILCFVVVRLLSLVINLNCGSANSNAVMFIKIGNIDEDLFLRFVKLDYRGMEIAKIFKNYLISAEARRFPLNSRRFAVKGGEG